MFDEDAMKRLLELSRLEVSDETKGELERQLIDIIGYFDRLKSFDTGGLNTDLAEQREVGSIRNDTVEPGIELAAIREFSDYLDEDGFFVVPHILANE